MQLHIWSTEVTREMKYDEKIHMTEANEISHENANTCYICDEILDEENAVVVKYEITTIVREHIVEPHIASVI